MYIGLAVQDDGFRFGQWGNESLLGLSVEVATGAAAQTQLDDEGRAGGRWEAPLLWFESPKPCTLNTDFLSSLEPYKRKVSNPIPETLNTTRSTLQHKP